MLYLASGTNNEGYRIAIDKCFDDFDQFYDMPSKGALTQIRKRISYRFFQEQFEFLKKEFRSLQSSFKGHKVYSIDGDIYQIPRSQELLDQGFYGHPVVNNKETFFLRMYSVIATDVFSGIPIEFSYGTRCRELELGLSLINKLGKDAICIYDRLYFSKALIKEHKNAQSYFLCRLQRKALKEAAILFNSSKKVIHTTVEGESVRIIKIINPKSKEVMVFATNLDKKKLSFDEIKKLYIRRWQSETTNRDLTATLKMEQFHSKDLNSILQEIYVHFWFICFSKMKIIRAMNDEGAELLSDDYKRSNFKEIVSFIFNNLKKILIWPSEEVLKKINFLVKKSLEKRKHNTRSSLRITKSYRRLYRGLDTNNIEKGTMLPAPDRVKNQFFQINHCC